jgi:uncharacterized protein YbbC (DUF1343 family)
VRRRAFLASTALPLAARRALGAPARLAVGLERVAADKGAPLRGRRVGLLAHAVSVTADGRHAIDVLRGAGVDVVRLFGPEHGLRGTAAAGEEIAGGLDAASGLPVVSLYGARTKPSAEDLRGLDVLVVDLQDVGVRFYTYASTMLLCLEAAAETGLDVVVLDRPNPLGGERVEGPERDPQVPFSLVSMAPGPLVHGLTLGEMALIATGEHLSPRGAPLGSGAEPRGGELRISGQGAGGTADPSGPALPKSLGMTRRNEPGRVSVVSMSGWKRGMTWSDTGRPWVNPSPNLRSAEAALAYPGTCLLEATNASEGRGTDAPFLLVGAPWVKAEAVAREAATPGFALEPAAFTPAASSAAPEPKHLGVRCQGLRVRVTDPAAARPWALGLGLLIALRRHPEFRWVREGAWLDTLSGTKAVRTALEGGDGVDAILAAEAPAIERWRRERTTALLYES